MACSNILLLVAGLMTMADTFLLNPLPPKRSCTSLACRQLDSESESDPLRRSLLLSSFITLMPTAANAGEVGARITKAVTTSDLGISVRTSVVKGAQLIDQIDGDWERFSDKFGLGTERSKRDARPAPKSIPAPLPLEVPTARKILDSVDNVYLSLMSTVIKPADLQERIDSLTALVRPSFQRSKGSSLEEAAEIFNFDCYVHFRAYTDIILQQGKGFDFNTFRRRFETQTGQQLIAILLPQPTQSARPPSEELIQSKLSQIDLLCQRLKEIGLLSVTERSPLEPDQIADWVKDESDLSFTIALDGDITLGSQMLLQEQGYYLYPDLARFAVLALLQDIKGQAVQVEDYYFDTDYNSDPDKFEVKEVVLNVVLDSV